MVPRRRGLAPSAALAGTRLWYDAGLFFASLSFEAPVVAASAAGAALLHFPRGAETEYQGVGPT